MSDDSAILKRSQKLTFFLKLNKLGFKDVEVKIVTAKFYKVQGEQPLHALA